MPNHRSFLGWDVPATGTGRQVASPPRPGVPQAAAGAAPPARIQAAERTPGRGPAAMTSRRAHAHCAQHESRGSDQVTPRWGHLPPPLPASSSFSADGREVPVLLPPAAKRGGSVLDPRVGASAPPPGRGKRRSLGADAQPGLSPRSWDRVPPPRWLPPLWSPGLETWSPVDAPGGLKTTATWASPPERWCN